MATILFVDDEFAEDDASQLGSYMSYYDIELREAGHNVIRVRDVDEALKRIDQPLDLAILDVMMPPGQFGPNATSKGLSSGVRLAERIHDANRQLPIVLLSNAAEHSSLFAPVLESQVVRRVLFKLDFRPADLLREIEGLLATGGQDA